MSTDYREDRAPPRDWQDFEDLCLKLWRLQLLGAKKNGRSGQPQAGVDVFGRDPATGKWWGIQCKQRGRWPTRELRTDEIEREIELAEGFEPPLAHFVLATTAPRDSKVQEFVRLLSDRRLADGKFSVDLFMWDDLREWLDEVEAIDKGRTVRGSDVHQLAQLGFARLKSQLTDDDHEYSEFFQKYIAAVYSAREDAEKLFLKFLSQRERRCFVVTGKAGKGKTSLFCHLAESLQAQPGLIVPILLSCSELSPEREDLSTVIARGLLVGTQSPRPRGDLERIARLIGEEDGCLIVFIDGLNELEGTSAFRDFNGQLEHLLSRLRHVDVKFCLSCRSELWFNFRSAGWVREEIFSDSTSATVGDTTYELGDFSESEIEAISRKYFEWYAIEGELFGDARRSCCDPIMLRYLCAAYSRRSPNDKRTHPSKIETYYLGRVRTLRRKEAFDNFVMNRRRAMFEAAQKIYDSDDERLIYRYTTLYLIAMAYAMYAKRRGYLEIREAIDTARSLSHPDAQLADRGEQFFLRSPESIFFRLIDEGIILNKRDPNTFSFTFESYFEYSLGRYLALERWPKLAHEHGTQGVIDDFQNLILEHKELSERHYFNNLFGALQFAVLILEQDPIGSSWDGELFVRLIETMSRASREGFDWAQQACATIRETRIAQRSTWRKLALAKRPGYERILDSLLDVLDDLTVSSEFVLLWDVEETLVALAAANADVTLSRIRLWAGGSRGLQPIFGVQALARLCRHHPEPVARLLLDLVLRERYQRDFWLARVWIRAARSLSALEHALPRALQEKLYLAVRDFAAHSEDPLIRGVALANLPFLCFRGRLLVEVQELIARESWPWSLWNLAFELRYWDPGVDSRWLSGTLSVLAEAGDEHVRYAVDSTLHEIRSRTGLDAGDIGRKLAGNRWRFGGKEFPRVDSRLGIVYSPAYLEPAYENHIECRERVQVIVSLLERIAGEYFTWVTPWPADPEELRWAHHADIDQHRDRSSWPRYLDDVFQAGEKLKEFRHRESLRSGPMELRFESYEAALLSVGGALRAVDYVLHGGARAAFALNRPPGHLANNAICVFNNVAIATEYARYHHQKKRCFILDCDAHHGYHTYRVFRKNADVVYFSIHVDGDMAAEAGQPRHIGEGSGLGYNFNVNYPPEMGDDGYGFIVEKIVVPVIREFRPDLILLSAGFDGHCDDPFINGALTEFAFIDLAEKLLAVAEELDVKIVGTLEGGYGLDGMSRSLLHMLRIFGGWPIAPETVGFSRTPARSAVSGAETLRRVREVVRERVRLMAEVKSRHDDYPFETSQAHWQSLLEEDA